jgi:hypothetical protein
MEDEGFSQTRIRYSLFTLFPFNPAAGLFNRKKKVDQQQKSGLADISALFFAHPTKEFDSIWPIVGA